MQYSSHQPIIISDLMVRFGNNECINKPFTNTVYYAEKIGIIGRNGSGKSSLIKVLAGLYSNRFKIHGGDKRRRLLVVCEELGNKRGT